MNDNRVSREKTSPQVIYGQAFENKENFKSWQMTMHSRRHIIYLAYSCPEEEDITERTLQSPGILPHQISRPKETREKNSSKFSRGVLLVESTAKHWPSWGMSKNFVPVTANERNHRRIKWVLPLTNTSCRSKQSEQPVLPGFRATSESCLKIYHMKSTVLQQ